MPLTLGAFISGHNNQTVRLNATVKGDGLTYGVVLMYKMEKIPALFPKNLLYYFTVIINSAEIHI